MDPKLKTEASKAATELGIPIIHLSPEKKAGKFNLKIEKKSSHSTIVKQNFMNNTSLLLHTSGTTSKPKLVQLTSDNLINSALNIGRTLDLNEKDCCLNIMPLFHIHGLVAVLLSCILFNVKLVFTTGFNALVFFKLLHQFKPTWYSGVPTMHQAILQRAKNNKKITQLLYNLPITSLRSVKIL